MKLFPILLLLVNFSLLGLSQNGESQLTHKDSLLTLINSSTGKDKILHTRQYHREYYNKEPKKVLSIIENLFDNEKLTLLDSVDCYYSAGAASFHVDGFEKYFYYVHMANDILDRYKGEESDLYNYLRFQYYHLQAIELNFHAKPKEALASFLEALVYIKKTKDVVRTLQIIRNIGTFHIEQGNYDKAIYYLKDGLSFSKGHTLKKKSPLYVVYSELGSAYTSINELDSAWHYLNKIPEQKRNTATIFRVGCYHIAKNEDFKAIAYLDTVIQRTKHKGAHSWLPQAQMRKADVLFSLKDYSGAEKLWKESRLNFLSVKDNRNVAAIAEKLYTFNKERGRANEALSYLEEYKMLGDSILYSEHDIVLKGIEDSYNLEAKEKEVESLQTINTLNSQKIEKQKTIAFLTLSSSALLILLLSYYYYSSRKKSILNRALEDSNTKLSTQNEVISKYANELSFVTENLLGGVAKLNADFRVIESDENFKYHCPIMEGSEKELFELLGFEDSQSQSIHLELKQRGLVSFVFLSEDSSKAFQLKIRNVSAIENENSYVVILDDITKIKEEHEKKYLEKEIVVTQLKSIAERNYLEKVELDKSLSSKNREIATKVLQISKRNSDLENLMISLKEVYKNSNNSSKMKLSKIIGRLNDILDIEDGWENFNIYFSQIYPRFIEEIQKVNNKISSNEIRHCTYIKMGLTNNEIANMLHLSPKTVEVTKYRIKKKLNLPSEDSLTDYLRSL